MFGASRFKEILTKYIDRPLILYGDPDVDGLLSLYIMCRWADILGLKYSYYVNDDRHHGFALNPLNLKGYLVIAADFTITQKEMEALVENDVVVLSTDHHECQREFIDVVGETAEGIVINNQYPFEPEEDKYLSGAGVIYELLCELYPEFKNKELEACVGITLLSDLRQIENAKAKKYLKTTYSSDPEQGYIKYLIENTLDSDFGFGVPRMDRNYIDYTLSPTVNALLRQNKTQEAVSFILGFGLSDTEAKGFQKEFLNVMLSRAQIYAFNNIDYIIVNTSEFLDFNVKVTSYIGLLCSDYKDKHGGKSTLGCVIENGKVVRSSFRGRYDDVHYLSGFRNLGIGANGHPPAFGITDFKPVTDTWYEIDDLVGDLESNHKPTITIINSGNLATTMLREGAKLATENCYVRDMYRSYIKYTGNNIKITRTTYKSVEFEPDDYLTGEKPDYTLKGVSYKYIRDENGNPIPKYIEYNVDGRKVKSFGVSIMDGLILPVMEKGYIQLYVRNFIS